MNTKKGSSLRGFDITLYPIFLCAEHVQNHIIMGYERLTASDDIDSGDRNAFDSIIAAQEGAKRRRIVREKLERLVWIFFSVAVVWYGDGTDSLFVLAARRAKVQRYANLNQSMTLKGALFCETHRIAFVACFVYILSGYGSCWPRFRLQRTSGSFVTSSSITSFIAEVRSGKSMRPGRYRRLRRLV